jgi:hypothetical protein
VKRRSRIAQQENQAQKMASEQAGARDFCRPAMQLRPRKHHFGPGKQFLNRGGASGKVIGGCSLSSILLWHTGHPLTTAFDADSRLIFNSNGEGTITLIHQDGPDEYSVVENVKTLPKAKTMALDPKTHRLFLSTAEAGQFEVLVVGR